MKFLATILFCLLAIHSTKAFTHEEILSALQRRADLLDPESSQYLTEKDKQVIDEFLKSNRNLFLSLGAKESFYYVDLIQLNERSGLVPNLCRQAINSAYRHWSDYTPEEKGQLEGAFKGFLDRGLISKEALARTKRRA